MKKQKGNIAAKVMGTLAAVGVYGLSYIAIDSLIPPNIHDIEIFSREDGPAVMRLYTPGNDGLHVEDVDNPGSYNSLFEYLHSIEDIGERELEEVRIKQVAGWYD